MEKHLILNNKRSLATSLKSTINSYLLDSNRKDKEKD